MCNVWVLSADVGLSANLSTVCDIIDIIDTLFKRKFPDKSNLSVQTKSENAD